MFDLSVPRNNLSISGARIYGFKEMFFTSFWILFSYAVYISSIKIGEGYEIFGVNLIWIMLIPLFVFGVWDFKSGLILSIVSTPLLNAPPIPHFFTQGIGDFFAVSAVIGFFVRGRFLAVCWRSIDSNLIFIPFVASVSFFAYLLRANFIVWDEIKYGIAEIAGLSLAVSYCFVLANSLINKEDLISLFRAVMVALFVAILYAVLSLNDVASCFGGLKGGPINSSGQVSSSFGNPNYFSSYMLAAIPFLFYLVHRNASNITLRRALVFLLFVIFSFLLFAVSRSVFVIYTILCIMLVLSLRDKRMGLYAVFILASGILFLTTAWYFRFFSCADVGDISFTYYLLTSNSIAQIFFDPDVFLNSLLSKTRGGLAMTEYGGVPGLERIYLLINALSTWVEFPVFGTGPGMLKEYSENGFGVGNSAHNLFITILAEQGALGFLVWVSLWIVVLKSILSISGGGEISQTEANQYKVFLLFAFVSLFLSSLLADQYRVIWLWQFIGLISSRYISSLSGEIKLPRKIEQV
ncbi:O-antigen ligase family protein [Thalassospira sp.]|uniref:O-antigen ligase family protein n=1 Tax=Thalassospira sp. TaxID=1912094 RepID=UPI000C56B14C|nr:O-antigen ligase family protein [Thalassospira sp.]MBC07607.1 hypothetical protein [Thalassospira sp.]|tara:strand:- start:22867 stop:24435 length:1569 start_codon:yes stop_codon:yes gene_type:complete